MFSTWGSTQDVGWVRYAFDHFEVKYDLIYKERIRKGNLRDSYDVIVIPNQGRGSDKSIVFDLESKGKPIDYTKSTEFPTLGAYGESDDITGGMGLEGVVELDKFVKAGGVLITLGVASFLPADFGLTPTIDAQRTSGNSTRPAPSSKPRSRTRRIRFSTAIPVKRFPYATPTVLCCASRSTTGRKKC